MAKKAKKKTEKRAQTDEKTDPKIRCSYSKLVAIEDLELFPNNPNIHKAEQLQNFAAILKYQGTRRPVRVSNKSKRVTVGHGQIEAYKINGWTHVPVDFQDYDNVEQEYADVVADNSLATWAQLDLDMVQKQVEEFGKNFKVQFLGVDGFSLNPEEIRYPEQRGNNEMTNDEKSTAYMASQSRNIILVYSLLDFNKATELLQRIMAAESHESFSDCVMKILEKHAKGLPKAG